MLRDLIPKEVQELNAFRRFAEIVGLSVDEGSIQRPDPPDIVCRTASGEHLAFELVGARGEDAVRSLGRDRAIEDELYAAAGDLTQPERSKWSRSFSDALIRLDLRDGVKANVAKSRAADLLAELLALPDDFMGETTTFFSPKIAQFLASMRVARAYGRGPAFSAGPHANFAPATEFVTTALEKKFRKDTHATFQLSLPYTLTAYRSTRDYRTSGAKWSRGFWTDEKTSDRSDASGLLI